MEITELKVGDWIEVEIRLKSDSEGSMVLLKVIEIVSHLDYVRAQTGGMKIVVHPSKQEVKKLTDEEIMLAKLAGKLREPITHIEGYVPYA